MALRPKSKAHCYKTNSRVKLLSKMGFLLRKINFLNPIAMKNFYSKSERKIKIIPVVRAKKT